MSEIKYFIPLSEKSLDTKIKAAMGGATHADQMIGLKSLEDTPLDKEELERVFKELQEKKEPTKFEAKWLMLMRRYFRAEIENAGEE